MNNQTIFITGLICIVIFLILGVSTMGMYKGNDGILVFKPSDENTETVWWNATELDSEPYTAPFFLVYKLKDLGESVIGLATADFNHDGRLDIVTNWWAEHGEENPGRISVFYGVDDSSFKIETVNTHTYNIKDLDAADFDGDGDIDILYSMVLDGFNNEYSMKILWNDHGEFISSDEVAHFSRNDGYWINPHLTTADFDMDGDVDLIVGANCGKVKLFKNDGMGNFSDEGVIFDYGDNSWGLDTADFNDDGYPDFIVCARTESGEYPFNDSGHIYLKLNDRTDSCFNSSSPGILISSIPLSLDDTAFGRLNFGSVAVLDYNADGLLDVVYGGDYKIFLFIQQNNGVFLPFYILGLRDREFTWSDHLAEGGFAVDDFNDDGLDDVVVGGTGGTVRLLINNQTFVNIVKPVDRWGYFFGENKYHMKYPGMKLVIGGIDVIAHGLEPLNRVDFYLNGKIIHSDNSEPFIWNWTKNGFGKCIVIAEAYDADGQFAGKDTMIVWKIL